MAWQTEGEGPTWITTLGETEVKYGIPTGLLARVAYQESRFREDIISGMVKSPAGAVGIMQLMPQYWPGAGVSPEKDIDDAGRFLSGLFTRFEDWQVALAAYNWGPGNVHKCLMSGQGIAAFPEETQKYVVEINADVPVPGSLV